MCPIAQAKLQALYSADQQFYNAVVDSATAEGNLVVTYEGYEEQAEVSGWSDV